MSKLDDLFKDKLRDRELPFNEAHWEAARRMIDAKDKRKRRGWWLFAVFGLLLGSLAAYWFVQTGPTANKANQLQLIEPSADREAQQGESAAKLSESNKTAQSKDDISLPTKSNLDKNDATVFKDVETTATAASENTNFKSAESKFKGSQISNTNSAFQKNEESKISNSPTSKKPQQFQSANSSDTNKQIANIENTKIPDPETVEKETVIQNKITAFDLLEIDYLALNSPERKADSKIKVLKQSPFSFGIKAGMLLQAPANQKSALIGAMTGIQFEYSFNLRWRLGAELMYTYRDGHFNRSNSSEQVTYRFGKEVTNYQLLPASLHYLSLPVYVQHRWNAYGLEAGIAPALLTGVRGTLLADPAKTANPGKSWIEPHGFKKFHVPLFLGLRYHMPGHLDIGFRASYSSSGILEETGVPDSEKVLLESDKMIYNILITKKL